VKRLVIIGITLTILLSIQLIPMLTPQTVLAAEDDLVYVIPIEQAIERGLERFLERAFNEAEESAADYIVLEIDTLGGEIDAALGIGKLIQREYIPVVAYIKGEAISAGAYIALNADKIYMEPSSYIGASAVRTITGEEVDPKITSVWSSHMEGAASQHGRNAEIAKAMVNPNIEIPGLSVKGELVTLSSVQAVKYGIADGVISNQNELLKLLGAEKAVVEEVRLSPAEQVARFVTNPYVIPFLFIIGLAGLVVELMIPGFGIPGLIGISSFGLYFFGHYFAGFAGWEAIIFFLAGFILMVIEVFVPGFGVFGIMGIISFVFGIASAAYQTTYGIASLVIAFVVNIILVIILIKYFGYRGVWNRFILKDEQKKESGYVAHNKDQKLVGKKGKTATKLRPAGIAIIEGKRYDVVSEGGLIPANQTIVVIGLEGTRIVVEEVRED